MRVLDSQPTGLLLITRLDPASEMLPTRYETIVKSFRDRHLAEYPFDRFIEECDIQSTANLDFTKLHQFTRDGSLV